MKKILITLICVVMIMACTLPAVSALTPHGTGIKMRDWLTNDPNYDFSDAYKTSVWYDNFTFLELTENERNNVLRIAVSQLGYHEGNSEKDFDGMNTSGSSNYIEYARLLIPHYNNNAYEWCACFVNWCLNQAHIDRYSSEIGCWKWVGELKAMKYWQDSPAYNGTYTPLPADMIFFNWKYASTTNKASSHIGYVLYTTETHVFTIEGNADNNVTVRSYALDDPSIIGYGTPDYKENNEPTFDYTYKTGMPSGYYVVNSSNAGVLASPDSSRRIGKVGLGHRVLVTAVEGNYAKITYGDMEGYLPTNILYYLAEAPAVTVTLDANGGQATTTTQVGTLGENMTLTTDIPTLEGDTFLGWATRPYDLVAVYKPGDTVVMTQDTTLYAVWEKHSETLAAAAMSEGILVNYPRPSQTHNQNAIVAGDLNPDLLTPISNTTATLVDNDTWGKVLSLSTTAASNDPYVTIPYASLMKSLSLPMAQASDVKYVVFRVMNESLTNTGMELFYVCAGDVQDEQDQTARVVNATRADGEGWTYVVFDMSEAKGWDGDIQTLRLDYTTNAAGEGEVLLISDLFLLGNDDQLNAVTQDNIYPFGAVEKVVYETETTPDTSVDTTEGETDGQTEAQTSASSTSGSCKSFIGMGMMPVLVLAGVCCMKRRRED